jgi:hypothetical protein
MFANHHYLAQQGYFDMAAFTKPLLHMWSLGVEEQFYLVAPLTLLGLTTITGRMKPENAVPARRTATFVLAAMSFIACVAFTYASGRANVSFYVMPTRGWEFILGGIVPCLVPMLRRRAGWISGGAAMAGVAAVLAAVVLFDDETLYPSYHATLPALGAMLIIASGLARPGNSIARALATGPMVGIGLVSYSWYLWHWPLLSFVRTMNFGVRDLSSELGIAALSLVLAALTYRLVEMPTRTWRRGLTRAGMVAVMGPAACILVASFGYVWALNVAPRLLPSIEGLAPIEVAAREFPPALHQGVLLGDSHATVVHAALKEHAGRAGASLTLIAQAGCPPVLLSALNDHRGQPVSYCPPFFQKIALDGNEFVILMARWNYYLGLPPSDPYFRSVVLAGIGEGDAPTDPYELLARGLAAVLAASERAGVRRVLVVGPMPEFPVHPPYCLMRTLRVGGDGCRLDRAAVDARRAQTMDALRRVTAGRKGARLIDPIELFCTASECRPNEGRTVYLSDSNHLSPAGTERFYNAYKSDFLWALTGDEGRMTLRK